MRTNSTVEHQALNPVRQTKPISHWEALQQGKVIGSNNSIKILRASLTGLKNVTFKAIR